MGDATSSDSHSTKSGDTSSVKLRKKRNNEKAQPRFHAKNSENELQKILNRRSRNIEEWESQAALNEENDFEKAVADFEQQLDEQRKQNPVTIDVVPELQNALKVK